MSSETTTTSTSHEQEKEKERSPYKSYHLRDRGSLPEKKKVEAKKKKKVDKKQQRKDDSTEPVPPKAKRARIATRRGYANRRFILFLCNDKKGRIFVVKAPSSTVSKDDLAYFLEEKKERVFDDIEIQDRKVVRDILNAVKKADYSPPPESWKTYETPTDSKTGWVLEAGEVAETVIDMVFKFS